MTFTICNYVQELERFQTEFQMEGTCALECIQMYKYALVCKCRWNKNAAHARAGAQRNPIYYLKFVKCT